MSRRPWDEIAEEATFRNSADWYQWARRNFPPANPTEDKAYWTRAHFKVALANLPAGHPDTWKYKAGARYAPYVRPGLIAPSFVSTLPWVLGALVAVLAFIAGGSLELWILWLVPLAYILIAVGLGIRKQLTMTR